ncbi:aminoacyl-tRNA hydrolase [Candidatus Saccharibacteria bacterium]|nr:aminoacyl-tRNA hydrolase [Candidatus Saccharibacteria bacterium]
MNLIVALGNPGNQYNFTRHNFGFLALDFYFKVNHLEWEPHEKFNSIWKKQGDTIFIKPQTFYNEVGQAAKAFADFYKIPPENILVICDDFNLKFGTIRERQKGSAGGNNGLKSIIANLKTENFPRIRLGTGNDELRQKIGDVDFVLSKFTEAERKELPDVLLKISKVIQGKTE